MTRDELNSILANYGIDNKELANALLTNFNRDRKSVVEDAKEEVRKEYEGWASPEEVEKLKSKNDELKESLKGYADYDDLKTFKSDVLAKEEEANKLAYLKEMKVKDTYAKMVMGQLDWSKGKYDQEKKTYTGLDEQIAASKETYKDLYEQEVSNPQVITFDAASSGNGAKPSSTPNSRMNAFIRGED